MSPDTSTADDMLAEGPRVRLRRIRREDFDAAARFLYTLSISEPLTDAERIAEVHGQTGLWTEDAGAAAIVERDSGRLLGTTQFYRASPVIHGYEIGYVLHDAADRGKGYASDALRLMSAWLFAHRPACHRLQLLIETYNQPSWRLAEACGYEREGVLRRAGFSSAEPEDCFLYARIREAT